MNFSSFSAQLTTSDYIEIFSIIISLITTLVAIIISVLTLRHSYKTLEKTTRPYMGVYVAATYIRHANCYLVVKNFGQSSAFIESFTYDFDLESTSGPSSYHPFNNIVGSTFVPQQANKSYIDLEKVLEQVQEINFHIVYCSGKRKYTDDICVKLNTKIGDFVVLNNSPNQDLAVISETLQDAYISSL